MTDPNYQKYEEIQTLHAIVEKAKRHKTVHHPKQILYVLVEVICYILFLCFLSSAFFLPDYLEMKLDAFEDEYIGFYTLDPKERKVWSLLLRSALIISSLLPLVTGILLRRLRIKNRLLNQVFKLANERILKLHK